MSLGKIRRVRMKKLNSLKIVEDFWAAVWKDDLVTLIGGVYDDNDV